MAHPEDLEKLRQGAKVWNEWRRNNPDYIPDFRDAELAISERQFGPGNGGPIDLSDSDLQRMVLRNSTLTDASLVRANLMATDLVQARLDGADLTGADLSDAMLDYADLTGANLNSTILVGASLVNVTGLTQAQIAQAHGDASTALPAYLLPPESWFPPLEGDFFESDESRLDLSPLTNDPYDILGVDRDATFDEIRAAFRTLVKRLHPDLNPNDRVAQERFKRVSIAYRVLGDPVKRDRYNRGEIDANGDVRPEFEAKKEFRRYAFKFYLAAAASLLLAIGILTAVWYTFWVQGVSDSNDSFQTANPLPPKQSERLITHKPSPAVALIESQEPAVPPSQITDITNAVQAGDSFDATANSSENSSTIESKAEITQPASRITRPLNPIARSRPENQTAMPYNAAKGMGLKQNGQPDILATGNPETLDSQAEHKAAHIEASGTATDVSKMPPAQLDEAASGDKPATSQTTAEKELSKLVAKGSSAISNAGTAKPKNEDDLIRPKAPLPDTSFRPVWPKSTHKIIYHKQPDSPGIVKDAVSEIFSYRMRHSIGGRVVQSSDSLQSPRKTGLDSSLDKLAISFANFFEWHDNLPDTLAEEILENTAAVDTKTAEHSLDNASVLPNSY